MLEKTNHEMLVLAALNNGMREGDMVGEQMEKEMDMEKTRGWMVKGFKLVRGVVLRIGAGVGLCAVLG